jgi:hypothetical protein
MKRIFLLLIIMIILGCATEPDERYAREVSMRQKTATEACLKQGGVPIYATWDNRLKDCKFK